MEAVSSEQKISVKKNIVEWTKFIVQLIIIYVVITNTIGFTRVIGYSMSPTLKTNSIVFVNKLSTHLGKPEYGDVVVVIMEGKGYGIIKRVIGLPGDTIAIKNGTVYVNNKATDEKYTAGTANDMKEVKVEENKVFVMGDNRTPGESLDSRDPDMGTLPTASIKGYAEFSVFPIYKISKP